MSGILNERIEMKLTIEQERQITAQYQYIKELATLKYDAEEKREQNLIQQSSQMQTAFSFMTAAVFAALAYSSAFSVRIEYRGKLTLNFFSDSSICCCFFADCESTFSILSAMEMENRSISRYTGYEGYGCK